MTHPLAWSLLLVLAASPAFAADVRVSYLVDGKALKAGAPAGTVLTFELHTTSACSAAVESDAVNVEDVMLLEQVKATGVKSGPKPPKSVLEIRHVLTGVTPATTFYLRVTGTGVTAIGGACQLQYASYAATSGGGSPPASCPPDSVAAGTTCVDKYEATLWGIPPSETAVIQKVKDGTVTLADLTGAGATQYACPGYHPYAPPTFPVDGEYTEPVYAVSIPGVWPGMCVSMPMARAACALSEKHLLDNEEWNAAAEGTPSYKVDDGATSCNTSYNVDFTLTGARSGCVSTAGAFDMVGNIFEWTLDDGIAWIRGGASTDWINAGVTLGLPWYPAYQVSWIGFRCGR